MVKCVYCRCDVPSERTMQICDRCGIRVWGDKMFKAILQSTDCEREKGNMELGCVSENKGVGSIQELHKKINNFHLGQTKQDR
jgi:hypothetical protein